jgi:hypothetical protein
MQLSLNPMLTKVCDLAHAYENDEYMLHRLNHHILNQLPAMLANEQAVRQKRCNRQLIMQHEQTLFIRLFLIHHKYFYLPNANVLSSSPRFYKYDDQNYTMVSEDSIIYDLCSSISNHHRKLMDWKYKTKAHVMKQIKQQSLFQTIPESYTIQSVLRVLYPTFVSTKSEAKYLLTIIGDILQKKGSSSSSSSSSLMYLMSSSKMKPFMTELDKVALHTVGINNISSHFLSKYHESHVYENYRLIKMNPDFSLQLWTELLSVHGLNIMCVASHYSNRYENAESYLQRAADEDVRAYVCTLKTMGSPDTMIRLFCDNCIQSTNTNQDQAPAVDQDTVMADQIEWKHVLFSWKHFLRRFNFPNVVYYNRLKTELAKRYPYDDEKDSFAHITSKYMPEHISFIQFWESTIHHSHYESELELDELTALFRIWCSKKQDKTISTSMSMNEVQIVNILHHFYPRLIVFDDKYIMNATCTLWDKNGEIINALNALKRGKYISLTEAYSFYCTRSPLPLITANKRYFDNFVRRWYPSTHWVDGAIFVP